MGLGIGEILLILLIAMLFFGWRNLLALPRALAQSMEERKRRPQGQRFNPHEFQVLFTSLLGGVLFITIMTLALADVISYEQMTVVMAVVFVWLIVGFYCFGKRD